MQIRGNSSEWRRGSDKGITSLDWLTSSALGWQQALTKPERYITLDMSNIELVTLFEWVITVSLIERVLRDPTVSEIHIDLVGSSFSRVLSPTGYINYRGGRSDTSVTKADYKLSDRVYRVAGFLESLGTLAVLNRPERTGKVLYPWVSEAHAGLRSFYTSDGGSPSIVLGLTRIEAKEDCKQFLDERLIHAWRNAMDERFSRSPLFESEEVWRVICHELAVNVWEHAGGVAGFLGARAVLPLDEHTRIKPWCQATYGSFIGDRLQHMRDGFLELCVGDAGQGFVETLRQAFLRCTNRPDDSEIPPEDILIFAFDELGTCKEAKESWATERHALGRILQIVAKYGGALSLRSGKAEVAYVSQGSRFERRRAHPGYEPQKKRNLGCILPGAHIQIILPLVPLFEAGHRQERPSVLVASLPTSFRTQSDQVRGHLVPLLEVLNQPEACIGREEQKRFREACEELSKALIENRPRMEPLVIDFGGLNWAPPQFETLLYLLQNVLQHRPVLLVEIDPELARGVVEMESRFETTHLDQEIAGGGPSATGRSYGELSEQRYLETYSAVHATVLGLDRDGKRYIFGLSDHLYEQPLLSLIESEKSIEELCQETFWGQLLNERVLRLILNCVNPMFETTKEGKWRTVWGPRELANEASRAMSRHFDAVVKRSEAWRGRLMEPGTPDYEDGGNGDHGYPLGRDTGKEIFNLPWQDEWREEFLEGSRILSRERQADEAAQRLIYRLRRGLEINGNSLEDVKVLACVTAPAMLLASALHRWWPITSRPAVADLGYYVMLSHSGYLPAIARAGGIVVVQDILDTGRISGNLVNVLRQQSLDVLCILGLVRLVPELPETRFTSIDEGWTPMKGEDLQSFVPTHAMIEMRRPTKCDPPRDDEDDSHARWIEPRALRPFRYPFLRREFEPRRDPDLDRRDQYLKRFDVSREGCLFAAGHYVYGHRHYAVAVDVHSALRGQIGEEIALWLADVCEGEHQTNKAPWERKDADSLSGDVTAVLMPLHSQIHYLWPRVANLLAQRGRRQPMWLLDATLFYGQGTAYRIPLQVRHQIDMAVRAVVKNPRDRKDKLRILIIDDAIATGRTAETILTTILREVENAYQRVGLEIKSDSGPIEWIRYFAVLNQMSDAHHILWRNIKTIGNPPIRFVLEEFAPFMGVPVYNESSCPTCHDRARLERLVSICEQHGAEAARQWAKQRFDDLQPVAIDSPGFQRTNSVRLPQPIDVLAPRSRPKIPEHRYLPQYTDTAIWRFYELMYMSYPPSDVLRSLDYAWPLPGATIDQAKEYERYRWAVLEWCLHNWSRILADTARARFKEYARKEVEENTSLVEPIFEAVSLQHQDPYIIGLVKDGIDLLVRLEQQRQDPAKGADPTRIKQVLCLDTALTLFFLNIPSGELEKLPVDDKGDSTLLDYLDQAARPLDPNHSFVRNLYHRMTRPQRYAKPEWALTTVATTLFRGRDQNDPVGRHQLLPRLINNVLKHPEDSEDRHLLYGSLTLFLAALDDIMPYAKVDLSLDATEIKEDGTRVLEWLKQPVDSTEVLCFPSELRHLEEALDLEGKFCKGFNQIFHIEVEELQKHLEDRTTKYENLTFTYLPDEDVRHCRVLTHVELLLVCLANLAIDPVRERLSEHKSRIEVHRIHVNSGADRVSFRILTNFASYDETSRLTSQGRSIDAERSNLEAFGAQFEKLCKPHLEEQREGFTAAYEFNVPTGFVPRSVK